METVDKTKGENMDNDGRNADNDWIYPASETLEGERMKSQERDKEKIDEIRLLLQSWKFSPGLTLGEQPTRQVHRMLKFLLDKYDGR